MNHKLAARSGKQDATSAVSDTPKPTKRPPQFPLGGLLGLMVVVGIAMAPAYYVVRGQQGEAGSQLAGMLIVLAGPLLLLVIVSSLLAVVRWWNR